MWTKGAFCKFSSTFLKSVEKIILAYIYIYLFLYLPICLFTYNNSRFSLFAYVCNNRMSKSSTAIYSFWPLPHCLKKITFKCLLEVLLEVVKIITQAISCFWENTTQILMATDLPWLCCHTEKKICKQNIHSWWILEFFLNVTNNHHSIRNCT